jgi:DNA modification methylase
VVPYEKNPRKNDSAVEVVSKSIKEFGFQQPIVVDGSGVVIVGHTRLKAALGLGLETVPVLVADNLTPSQVQAYRIMDNKSSESADWDLGSLVDELLELDAANYDLDFTGFSELELEKMIVGDDDENAEGDMPEPLAAPASVVGDVWVMGDHRLACGDSTDVAVVDRLMAGSLADLIFTDPPWNVNYGGSDHPSWKTQDRTIMNDHMNDGDWAEFVSGFCAALLIASKEGAGIYCVMSAQEWPVIDFHLRQAGFHWSSTIIWAKDRLVLSRKDYHTQYEPIWFGQNGDGEKLRPVEDFELAQGGDYYEKYEPIFYGWNGGGPRIRPLADRKQSDLWEVDRPSVSELHPTTKPTDLIDRALVNSSRKGDVVLDLFGGSGSTLIACENRGRAARLMELDPRYADVIVQRWQNHTGLDAVLEDDGRTFEELRAERVAE